MLTPERKMEVLRLRTWKVRIVGSIAWRVRRLEGRIGNGCDVGGGELSS